ncbi:MFS transporter [Paenibacillus sp. NFR01]|uniref:MFS transporter n=1 Tax=Paenibacillus sp. NFR01 TaxID=1566279 RepID=UPI0008D712D2|nr:MFS transporter [Paenibacillus sp. NFR01]SET14486.1 MFS transporter, PPP family, 3-phenylpropionic acid transporter [Paenibacillus sp. NFR01]
MNTSFLLKGFNFIYFALLAMFIPFLPVYLDNQGLSPAKIGFIIGTGGVVTIIAQPLWGMISDRTKTIRKVLLLLLVCSAVLGYLLYASASYTMLVIFAMLLYFVLMPIDPLTESLNFRIAESEGISYGSIRTYGALGYGVMALLTGYVLVYFGAHGLGLLFAASSMLGLLLCWKMPDAPVAGKPVTLNSLKQFLANRQTLLFLLLIFVSSVPARMNDTFLGVYILELGGKSQLVGQSFFIAAASEIVVFALSYRWLRSGKELITITIAGAFYFIRFFLSAWISDPHLLAYLQVLQLLTFPVFYSAAIQYLYSIVPAEWRATGQTVLALLFFGVSGILSSYAGGLLYNAFGGQTMYFCIAALSLAGTLFGFGLHRRYVA